LLWDWWAGWFLGDKMSCKINLQIFVTNTVYILVTFYQYHTYVFYHHFESIVFKDTCEMD
jgi:hypothetical protein